LAPAASSALVHTFRKARIDFAFGTRLPFDCENPLTDLIEIGESHEKSTLLAYARRSEQKPVSFARCAQNLIHRHVLNVDRLPSTALLSSTHRPRRKLRSHHGLLTQSTKAKIKQTSRLARQEPGKVRNYAQKVTLKPGTRYCTKTWRRLALERWINPSASTISTVALNFALSKCSAAKRDPVAGVP